MPALGVGNERVDRPLALELAQDRRIRASDGVREDVQAAAVRDPDDDLVRPAGSRELDCLVQHGHERVETFDRELLLADESPPEERLERFDLSEAEQEGAPLLGLERLPEAPRLDRVAKPDALGVVGDVLDLVGDRSHVDLAQAWERVEQRVSLDVEAQDARRDLRLDVGGQGRAQALGLERRIAGRLGPERIDARSEMPVHPDRLDERHGGRHRAQVVQVGRRRGGGLGRLDGGRRLGGWWRRSSRRRGRGARPRRFRPSALARSTRLRSPGKAASTSSSAFSNSARHAGSTASGFSRYCSRTRPT